MQRSWIKKAQATYKEVAESVRTSASQTQTELLAILDTQAVKIDTNCTSTRQSVRNQIWEQMKKHMNKYDLPRRIRRSMAKDAAKIAWFKIPQAGNNATQL